MKQPIVTVITPSYNQGRFIEQTIQSVLSQDYSHIEYLVIDGGSTDNTIEILKKHEKRLHWISEPDRGQTDAINKGIRRANGEILCWLNSDDTYEPGAISRAVQYFLEHPDVMMVYGEGNEIDENGNLIRRFPATQSFDLWKLIHVWDYILQPTAFFRKEVFNKIALPDTSRNWCMDWDLWIRIGSKFKVAYISDVFANSRLHSETKTGSGGLERFDEIVSVMRKYGTKKYPLGYFLYGEDTIETLIKQKSPAIFTVLFALFKMSRLVLLRLLRNYQEYYGDKWIGRRARFMLPISKYTKAVELNIEFQKVTDKIFPNTLKTRVSGGQHQIHKIDGPGSYSIKVQLPPDDSRLVELEMKFQKTFVPDKENRKLSCLLHGIRNLS
jgi:glycosyltransferase involved in cell wall biosynthesis